MLWTSIPCPRLPSTRCLLLTPSRFFTRGHHFDPGFPLTGPVAGTTDPAAFPTLREALWRVATKCRSRVGKEGADHDEVAAAAGPGILCRRTFTLVGRSLRAPTSRGARLRTGMDSGRSARRRATGSTPWGAPSTPRWWRWTGRQYCAVREGSTAWPRRSSSSSSISCRPDLIHEEGQLRTRRGQDVVDVISVAWGSRSPPSCRPL